MNEVERVQYRGALAVTGTWKGTNRSKLYDELGWESLSDRRKKQRLVLLYKIINNLTPSYLRDKLPPLKTDLPLKRRMCTVNSESELNDSGKAFSQTPLRTGIQ
jgi:hypothetical protein